MTNNRFFIPVNGTPIEVSEKVYRAYYQPIWNTRYHAQKNGECRCTKAQLWKCDGVCPGCPFYAAGKKVSIDTPIGGEEDELTLGATRWPTSHRLRSPSLWTKNCSELYTMRLTALTRMADASARLSCRARQSVKSLLTWANVSRPSTTRRTRCSPSCVKP